MTQRSVRAVLHCCSWHVITTALKPLGTNTASRVVSATPHSAFTGTPFAWRTKECLPRTAAASAGRRCVRLGHLDDNGQLCSGFPFQGGPVKGVYPTSVSQGRSPFPSPNVESSESHGRRSAFVSWTLMLDAAQYERGRTYADMSPEIKLIFDALFGCCRGAYEELKT
jgi:hypothetical protein